MAKLSFCSAVQKISRKRKIISTISFLVLMMRQLSCLLVSTYMSSHKDKKFFAPPASSVLKFMDTLSPFLYQRSYVYFVFENRTRSSAGIMQNQRHQSY